MSKSEKHNPARRRRGRAEEVECTRSREVDPSAALTSGIHLLVLFLNLIHLAAQQTSVACWKGFMCVMDAIVRNAKVNMRRSGEKKRGLSYFKSASHVSSSLQSDLASLCNNIQREDNCWVHAHGLALIFKTGHGAAERRPVSLMTVCRRITYTEKDSKWSCTVWRECWETIMSWFERLKRRGHHLTARSLYKSN